MQIRLFLICKFSNPILLACIGCTNKLALSFVIFILISTTPCIQKKEIFIDNKFQLTN